MNGTFEARAPSAEGRGCLEKGICSFDFSVHMTPAGLQWTQYGLSLFVFSGWKFQAGLLLLLFPLFLCLAPEACPGSQAILLPLALESVPGPESWPLVWAVHMGA